MTIKSPTTTPSKVRSPHLKMQKMHEVYLKRRSQRIAALKKVVKQWHLVEEAERFFDSLEEWHAILEEGEEGSGIPDDLSDLATWAINEEECNLDEAINRLVAADKRVHDAVNAMGDVVHADQPGAPLGTLGGFATKKTRWPLVFYDAARRTASIEKFPGGKCNSKPAPSRNHAELGTERVVQLREWLLRAKRGNANKRNKP
jgi:hypothetical protein